MPLTPRRVFKEEIQRHNSSAMRGRVLTIWARSQDDPKDIAKLITPSLMREAQHDAQAAWEKKHGPAVLINLVFGYDDDLQEYRMYQTFLSHEDDRRPSRAAREAIADDLSAVFGRRRIKLED